MIYFDNSATSYPKPVGVARQCMRALRFYSFNSGRGGYRESLRAADKIYEVRELIGSLVNFPPENIVFTKNCTEALNIAVKGLAKAGGHVIISSLEHNSVSRIVQSLSDQGIIDYDIARFSSDETECTRAFAALIKENTCAVICMHASNVFGVTFPIAAIGALCREKGIPFIVDAAQSVGALDLDGFSDQIDVLCAPGHKCLMGPMGTGFLAVRDGISLKPLCEGGTGSASLSLQQPAELPDRLESGTLNNPGIIALGEGIRFINTFGIKHIYNHEMKLSALLYDALCEMDKVKLYTGRPEVGRTVPIISFNVEGRSSEAVAAYLAEHNICVRSGYHCSYLAHRHFCTLQTGTVRLSLGYFNTEDECERFLNVLKKFVN
ncbi:MAG: aminotransferase class V-fold PLP-dependent enzyme [Eubacterium sp.]|nr:aminotransferase class V-fold PLP-dependent enzyme [Eubacterium sp.]